MQTIIEWTKLNSKNKPCGYGWYVAILKPENYKEFEEGHHDYTDWVRDYGFNTVWFNNGKFWENSQPITDRVIYFAKQPEGFM